MRATFDELGGQPRGIELSCANRIPHGRGLGSSAAAIMAGVLLARALVLGGDQAMPMSAVLDLASRLEGHPDNVAACLLGGLTIAWTLAHRTGATGPCAPKPSARPRSARSGRTRSGDHPVRVRPADRVVDQGGAQGAARDGVARRRCPQRRPGGAAGRGAERQRPARASTIPTATRSNSRRDHAGRRAARGDR